MIGKLRKHVQWIPKILAKPFIALKIHPIWITLLAIPLALITAYFIAIQQFGMAFIIGVITVVLDYLDGTTARALNLQSNWGNYLDAMIDKYVEFILLAGFAVLSPLLAFVALCLGMIEGFAKPRVGLVIITDNRDWPAIGEHADKLVLILLGLLILNFTHVIENYKIVDILLSILIGITFIGGIQRILYAKKLIKEAEQDGTL